MRDVRSADETCVPQTLDETLWTWLLQQKGIELRFRIQGKAREDIPDYCPLTNLGSKRSADLCMKVPSTCDQLLE